MTPQPTPAQLLADNVVLSTGQTAIVLGLVFVRGKHKGEPNRHKVIELVDAGILRPIDPKVSFPRWTFSVTSIQRYLEGGPALQLVRNAS